MTTPPSDPSASDPSTSGTCAPTLRLDLSSPVPPYEQLREQLAGLISVGELRPGQRLPPVRQLAADLGLAPGTIARAYRELEQSGLVEGRGRRGTIVRASRTLTTQDEGQQRVLAAAQHLATLARDFGVGDETVLAAVRTALTRTQAASTV